MFVVFSVAQNQHNLSTMTKKERRQRMLIITAKMDLRHQEHAKKMDMYFKKQMSDDEWEKEQSDFELEYDSWNQEWSTLQKADNIQKVKEVTIGLLISAVLIYLLFG